MDTKTEKIKKVTELTEGTEQAKRIFLSCILPDAIEKAMKEVKRDFKDSVPISTAYIVAGCVTKQIEKQWSKELIYRRKHLAMLKKES